MGDQRGAVDLPVLRRVPLLQRAVLDDTPVDSAYDSVPHLGPDHSGYTHRVYL